MPEASIECFFSGYVRKFCLLFALLQKDSYVPFDSILLLHLFVHIWEIVGGLSCFPE